MIVATMMAYQAIFLTPILAVYVGLYHRRERARWALLLVPGAMFIEWQVFTRLTTGAMPAAKLAGYFSSYDLQALAKKAASALMLFIHSWWIVFPATGSVRGDRPVAQRRESDTHFLLAWIGLFFACGLVVFFAGSARYLLPMAAPVCLLASRLPVKWLAPSIAIQLAVGLLLAAVNYQHWDGYRAFSAGLRSVSAGHAACGSITIGACATTSKGDPRTPGPQATNRAPRRHRRQQRTRTQRGGSPRRCRSSRSSVIDPAIPLRLIGLETYSGYSSVDEGFLPFGMEGGVIDRVTARIVMERRPVLEYLQIGTQRSRHRSNCERRLSQR